MAAKQAIAMEIERRVQNSRVPNFKSWRIGITHDPGQRYQDWSKPPHFLWWQVNSLQDAQAVETYFIHQKGMLGGTGGDLSAGKTAYVYIC